MADKIYEFTKGRFPSELAPNEVKNSDKYGVAFAQAIYSSSCEGTTSYYNIRNAQFAANRSLSSGKQEFEPILKVMGIDGQNAYVKLDYKPRGIAMKFKEVTLNKFMDRDERVKVSALSMAVKTRKDRKKTDASFRMSEKEFIAQLEQETGEKFEAPDAFTPKTKEELDIYSELNDQEKEELLMQEAISFVFKNNKYNPVQKRALLSDIWDCGLVGSLDYLDAKGRIITEVIRPETLVYSPTLTTDFSDARYIGHFKLTQISALREQLKAKKIDELEQKLYDLAYSNRNENGNSVPTSFNDEWVDSQERPYDDCYVRVLYFTVKLPKQIIYTKGKNKYGRAIFDRQKEAGTKENPNKQTVIEKRTTIYKGAWVVSSDFMLQWGEDTNILVDNEKETLEHPYSLRLVSNDDGKMLPRSMADLMRSPIEAMDLDIVKMQQIIANISPNGYRIDIDVLDGLDLGKGLGKVSILQLKQIAKQTGDVFYSSKNLAGDQKNHNPIEQNIYQLGNTIEQLMGHYNFELNNLKQLIGTNDAADGTSLDPRMGKGVVESQVGVSNTATANIYSTFVQVKTDTARHIGIRLWDEFKFSDNPNRGYLQLLGKKNADFLKYRKDLTESNYDMDIELDMSDRDRMQLEKDIEIGMGSGLLLEDAIYIRQNFTDYKKAAKYLSYQRKVRQQEAMDEANANSATQAQIQQQSAQMASEAKQQEIQLEAQAKTMEWQAKGQTELSVKEMDIVRVAMEKQMDNPDVVLPEFVQMLIVKYQEQELKRRQAEQEQEIMEQEQMEQEAMAAEQAA